MKKNKLKQWQRLFECETRKENQQYRMPANGKSV